MSLQFSIGSKRFHTVSGGITLLNEWHDTWITIPEHLNQSPTDESFIDWVNEIDWELEASRERLQEIFEQFPQLKTEVQKPLQDRIDAMQSELQLLDKRGKRFS